MGFLKAGKPLQWSESLREMAYVREHGVRQFLALYHRVKDRRGDVLRWGDEVEYHLVALRSRDATGGDDSARIRVALIAPEVLSQLEEEEKAKEYDVKSAWHPEYGSWMVEATPGIPYGNKSGDLLAVEVNMATRRARMRAVVALVGARLLGGGGGGEGGDVGCRVVPMSLVAFPLMGVGAFTEPPLRPGGVFSMSKYIPDAAISPHPRFGTLTANIRTRRGERVTILVPMHLPTSSPPPPPPPLSLPTPSPTSKLLAVRRAALSTVSFDGGASGDESGEGSGDGEGGDGSGGGGGGGSGTDTSSPPPPPPLPPAHPAWSLPEGGFVHGDAMAFGMGCCCLQVTFQARDLKESRRLYDALAVISPLMLALSAATPIFRGRLVATDTRWDIISDSVDDRTPAERGSAGVGRARLATSAAADHLLHHNAVTQAVRVAEKEARRRGLHPPEHVLAPKSFRAMRLRSSEDEESGAAGGGGGMGLHRSGSGSDGEGMGLETEETERLVDPSRPETLLTSLPTDKLEEPITRGGDAEPTLVTAETEPVDPSHHGPAPVLAAFPSWGEGATDDGDADGDGINDLPPTNTVTSMGKKPARTLPDPLGKIAEEDEGVGEGVPQLTTTPTAPITGEGDMVPSLTTAPTAPVGDDSAPALTTAPTAPVGDDSAPALTTAPTAPVGDDSAPALTTAPTAPVGDDSAPALTTAPTAPVGDDSAPVLTTAPTAPVVDGSAPALTTAPTAPVGDDSAPALTTAPTAPVTDSPLPALSAAPTAPLTASHPPPTSPAVPSSDSGQLWGAGEMVSSGMVAGKVMSGGKVGGECGEKGALPAWMGEEGAEEASAKGGRRRLLKSRYSSIDCYLADDERCREEYNDIPVVVDEKVQGQLIEGGVDPILARHVAHLFVRDPLVIFDNARKVDDSKDADHWENFQSTNWCNVRWKPPPADAPDVGWRVELRTIEVAPTDFENAALTVFSVLLSRVILFYDLDLYIPISLVDANFVAARGASASSQALFYFRRKLTPLEGVCGPDGKPVVDKSSPEWRLMSMDEILMGVPEDDTFPGLIALISTYLDLIHVDGEERKRIDAYLRLLVGRARGDIQTPAEWMRQRVEEHPEYQEDGVVTPSIAADLVNDLDAVVRGDVVAAELLGHDGAKAVAKGEAAAEADRIVKAARAREMEMDKRGEDGEIATTPGKTLRGSSFAAEVAKRQDCALVRALVAQHHVTGSFKDTPSFLGSLPSKK